MKIILKSQARCAEITLKGTKCKKQATKGSLFCAIHLKAKSSGIPTETGHRQGKK